jgi:hypothetical protein
MKVQFTHSCGCYVGCISSSLQYQNLIIMHKIIYSFAVIFLLTSCSSALIAVDDTGWEQKETLAVKGRNGFLINEKLSFGEFKTTSVKRFWTKGSSWSISTGVNDWVERLNVEFVKRKQTVRFNLTDAEGNESQVTAFSKVRWTDLTVGNNPNSVINIIGDLLQIGDAGTNTYAVRIAVSKEAAPWEMLIDNNAAQRKAKTYRGILARTKSDYYTIAPVYQLRNKQGKNVSLPLGGSVGFEFQKPDGKTVAAVSLIDNGVVYLNKLPNEEKFLLANAAAALLLQQQLDEQF